MKVIFNTQSENPEKHPQMPDNYPFHQYEVDDSFDGTDLILQGYNCLSEADFDSYVSAIDLTAYNNATAPNLDEIIEEKVAKLRVICADILQQFLVENILMGIDAPTTILVANYLHMVAHYLQYSAVETAIYRIDALLAAPIPDNLKPFITFARLTTFKEQLILRTSEV
jgi:hypothetical protein